MQITIHVPDDLPSGRIHQRIRELEDSLREEARFFADLSGKSPKAGSGDDPWQNPNLDLPTADTGVEDFALHHDRYLYGSEEGE
jgi:hypothetical protein